MMRVNALFESAFESMFRKQAQTALAVLAVLGVIVGAGGTANAAESGASDATGAAIYEHYCIACHDRGVGHPGTQNLAYRYGPEKAALADRDNLTPEYVRIMVRFGRGLMPGFRSSEISDEQLKLLVEYLAAGPHPAVPPSK
jgi:mono/diheme cytochrome c family protein